MRKETEAALLELGVRMPSLLLPAPGVDLHRYACIACDQFSSQPEYWQQLDREVGSAPSTLRMILPEVWLQQPDLGERIRAVDRTMQDYLAQGVLQDIGQTFVYLQRTTASGTRSGLMAALDLEQYDYSPDSKSLIRATEATVVDRLPPRIRIRRDAPLELPHIMVLLDDRRGLLMDLLARRTTAEPPLYDFDLLAGGGHIRGWRADDDETAAGIASVLARLKAESPFLFAMGDGNHSFAAAKSCWEALRPTLTAEERLTHPARFALVELVNLYDPALRFEPIHRVLFGVDPAAVQRELGFDAACPPPLQQLQPMLDEWLSRHPEARIDYIHGADDCRRLGRAPDRLSILMPEFDKESLFGIVARDGCLVRKSFSMGEAREKRYYLEGRRIR